MFSQKLLPSLSSGLDAGGFLSAPSRHPVRCDDGEASNLSRVEGAVQKPSTSVLTWRSSIAPSAFCAAVAVLYARKNSVYKKIAGCDVFDQARDARTFFGQLPVIAHPPCRLWGRLYKFSTAPAAEKLLAFHAVHVVRTNGGVLEHPAWSKLWSAAGLPLPGVRDSFGGFTLPILQSWFGHKAPKATWLYIVGIEPAHLPSFPFALGIPTGRICASHSMKLREGTPVDLAHWLVELAKLCKPASSGFRLASAMSAPARMREIASCAFSKLQKSLFDQAQDLFSVQAEIDLITCSGIPPSGVTRSHSVPLSGFSKANLMRHSFPIWEILVCHSVSN